MPTDADRFTPKQQPIEDILLEAVDEMKAIKYALWTICFGIGCIVAALKFG